MVEGLVLVLANGSTVTCSKKLHPGLFQAARLSLGSIGIVTEITMKVVPAFGVRSVSFLAETSWVLENLAEFTRRFQYFKVCKNRLKTILRL
jgi:L-gulono-1,4-lactone dehydrogenase